MSTLADAYRGNAGWRQTTRNRVTGYPTSIYDGEAAGMDTCGGRWQTVCEQHGYIVSHETLALARYHAPGMNDWCGDCTGNDPSTRTWVPA